MLDNNGTVLETREQIIERLKVIVKWIAEKDSNIACDLDLLVYKLETLAAQNNGLVEVTRERDAAWADLKRIQDIVNHPLKIVELEQSPVKEIESGR